MRQDWVKRYEMRWGITRSVKPECEEPRGVELLADSPDGLFMQR